MRWHRARSEPHICRTDTCWHEHARTPDGGPRCLAGPRYGPYCSHPGSPVDPHEHRYTLRLRGASRRPVWQAVLIAFLVNLPLGALAATILR